MAERICTDPTIIELSKGKGVCNPRFAKIYKDNSNCNQCPKASKAITARDRISDAKTTKVKTPYVQYEH